MPPKIAGHFVCRPPLQRRINSLNLIRPEKAMTRSTFTSLACGMAAIACLLVSSGNVTFAQPGGGVGGAIGGGAGGRIGGGVGGGVGGGMGNIGARGGGGVSGGAGVGGPAGS